MAYSYSTRRRALTSRRRGGRRGYSKYSRQGRNRVTSGKKKMTRSSSTSVQALKKQLEEVQQLTQVGKAHKYTFRGDAGYTRELRLMANDPGKYYWAVPVSEILQAICSVRSTTQVFVTGFALEGDLYHAFAVDAFMTCVVAPSSDVEPIDVDGDAFFALGRHKLDDKSEARLWDGEEKSVSGAFKAAYIEVARDGTLFNAPMSSRAPLKGNFSFSGKKTVKHRGRASASLTRKGDAKTGLAAARYVKETFRVWWDVRKMMTVLGPDGRPSGDEHRILCGLRPQVEEFQVNGMSGAPAILAYIKDVRLTVYFRYG